jgi:ABC-type nitrate/sulfonate/bicarbonate transport system permease component
VDQIFVAVIVVAALTAVLFVVVDTLCRLATPWQRERP